MEKIWEKIVVFTYMLILWTMNAFGCNPFVDTGKEYNDLVFVGGEDYYSFFKFGENADQETYYIPDEFSGLPITRLGGRLSAIENCARFSGKNLKTVYVPWSVKSLFQYVKAKDGITIISASTEVIPAHFSGSYELKHTTGNDLQFIIPNNLYLDISEDGVFIDYYGHESRVSGELFEACIPANVSYFFNYDGEPNEGYFFVDLMKETGKLTKPPYDPKREGYSFSGWYKDVECTVPFDFDSDEIVISFDEEGNRIYNEFSLYAKWISE